MIEWFGFEDFKPATGTFYTNDKELIYKTVWEARNLLLGWTDQQIRDVTSLIFDECDRYISLVADEAESIRGAILDAAMEYEYSRLMDEFNCNGETIEFDVANEYVRWPTFDVVDEYALSEMITKNGLCEFIFKFYHIHADRCPSLIAFVRSVIKPANEFCEKNNIQHGLAPTNIERTFIGWLREHRKDCPICEKKIACSTPA